MSAKTVIEQRLSAPTDRPLWSEAATRFAARRPGYRAAGPNIDADAPPEVVAARICAVLRA